MEADGAHLGNVQRFIPGEGQLEIVAQHGFSTAFLRFFKFVSSNDGTACGRAIRLKTRVVIEDVLTDLPYRPYIGIATEAGYRAVQSTPILGPGGELLGVLSTHFRQPHLLSAEAAQRLDVCATEAAAIMTAHHGNAWVGPGHDPAQTQISPELLSRLVAELVERNKSEELRAFTPDERALLWDYVRRTPLLTSEEEELVRRCAVSATRQETPG